MKNESVKKFCKTCNSEQEMGARFMGKVQDGYGMYEIICLKCYGLQNTSAKSNSSGD